MAKIEDGSGKGYWAEVNDKNKLEVDSVGAAEFAYRSDEFGDCYNLNSGHVSIANSEAFAFLYLKNTGTKNIYIHSVRTCSYAKNRWELLKDITSGTIIDDAREANTPNLNFASGKTPTVTAYVGGSANTFVGGTRIDQWMNQEGHSEEFLNGALIVSPGTTLTLTGSLDIGQFGAAANTACARIIYYYKD